MKKKQIMSMRSEPDSSLDDKPQSIPSLMRTIVSLGIPAFIVSFFSSRFHFIFVHLLLYLYLHLYLYVSICM